MSKITQLRDAVIKELGTSLSRKVIILDGGNLTTNELPWIRTMLTDSDQGNVGIFIVSDLCFDDEYFDRVVSSIIQSIRNHNIVKFSNTDDSSTHIETVPTVSKVRRVVNGKKSRALKNVKGTKKTKTTRGIVIPKEKKTKKSKVVKTRDDDISSTKRRGRPKKIK